MSAWVTKPLGEVIHLQRGFDLPVQVRCEGPFPVIASTGQVGSHVKAMVSAPGVVIGRSGSLGGSQYIERDFWPLNTTLWAKDFNGNDPRFCHYLLSSLDLAAFNAGGAVPTLNRNHIAPLPVRVPQSARDQRAIADVLGALDDKIELNRRMSQTLEAIAQAIFKSCFVDNTPDDAQPVTLKDLTTKIGSGATPRGGREVYIDEGVALIRSQNVYDSQFVWDGLARITDEAARQLANVQVQAGDVLLNITGASILRTCVVPPDVLPARVNQHVAIIRAKTDVSPHFLHLHLLQPDTKAYLLGLNAGASREAVTKAHIESVPILDPGVEGMARFDAAVAPLFALAQACSAEARTLAAMRDSLLPKLLSGEVPVAAIEPAA